MIRIAVLIGFIILFNNQAAFSQDVSGAVEKIGSLYSIMDRYYVDTVNFDRVAEQAIISTLKQLDPHSVYISKNEVEAMNEPLIGNFEGIGIQFNILNDTILVVSSIAGGPSEELGIMAGDRIIKVNDTLVAGVSINNQGVIDRLRGKKGTTVKVSVKRGHTAGLLDFNIVRDKIPIFSVDAGYMVKPKIGYIKLNRFSATSMQEISEKMEVLLAQGMENLILDLQGNSGGYLQTAIDLADEFLSNRKLIVYTEGRAYSKNERLATAKGRFEKGKLIVLVDNGSASASEIVAGAIQDWDRGIVMGRRSFGKGLVQKPYNLPDGSMVRLTIQRYHTPTGRCIQKPYEEYKNDYFNRLEGGELFHLDSIDLPDSLIYYTPNNRVVYGGGGIIPDVFVPVDTTYNSEYLWDLRRNGLINRFVLEYLDRNRDVIAEKYGDIEQFSTDFQVSDSLLTELISFAQNNDVALVEEDMERSKPIIKQMMKAIIARSFWSSDGYYYIINQINAVYLQAISKFEDGSFENMDLTY